MLKSVKEDIYRNQGARCTNILVRIKYALVPGNRVMWLIRHYQAASCRLTRMLWAFLCAIDKFTTGVQIPPQTRIGRGCRILHFGNIVINPDAVIGDNFNIAQGCLIGNANGKHKGAPTIGNNCYMGANSIVLGGGINRQ